MASNATLKETKKTSSTPRPAATVSKKAVLLVNLGSPDSPSLPDVRRYLTQFLMDKNVIDAPLWLRALIVYGTILPFRPKSTAAAYRAIWTEQGSPLVAISERVRKHLDDALPVRVGLAMRYGNPSVADAIHRLVQATNGELSDIHVIPMYPHYAASSYGTAVEEVKNAIRHYFPQISATFQPPFFADPGYIDALVESIRPSLEGKWDHVLFTYHGLPERHLRKADPTHNHCLAKPDCCFKDSAALPTCYRAQVLRTTAHVTQSLGLAADRFTVSFQSRLGRDPWIKPFTDDVLEALPKRGVKRLVVVSPAFVADCLETLEELGDRGRRIFLAAGGEEYTLVPCLNDHPLWLKTLESWAT